MGKTLDKFNTWVESGQAPGFGRLNRQMDYMIKNRPKYEVQDEYYDNLALARGRAFGRDRATQMAEENVDRDVATGVGAAKQVTSSTGSLLDTIRSISDSGFQAKRGLAAQEAQLSNQRAGELYGANAALGEEQDKAWNYNTNMPYQLKIGQIREKRKFRQEMMMKAMDVAGSVATGGMYRGSGGGGGVSSSDQGSYYGPEYDIYGTAGGGVMYPGQ